MEKFENISLTLDIAEKYDSTLKPYFDHIDCFRSLGNLSEEEDEIVICEESLENAKKMLVLLKYSGCRLPNLEDDDIYPSHYGTVIMDFYLNGENEQLLSLEVGKDGYGFYIDSGITVENKGFAFDEVPRELYARLLRKPSNELSGVLLIRYAYRSLEHAMHCLNSLSDVSEILPEEVPDDIEDFVDKNYSSLRELTVKMEKILEKHSYLDDDSVVKDFCQEYDSSLDEYLENKI